MECPECGLEVDKLDDHCIYCGTNLMDYDLEERSYNPNYSDNNVQYNKQPENQENSNGKYIICCLLFLLFWLFSLITYHPNI